MDLPHLVRRIQSQNLEEPGANSKEGKTRVLLSKCVLTRIVEDSYTEKDRVGTSKFYDGFLSLGKS